MVKTLSLPDLIVTHVSVACTDVVFKWLKWLFFSKDASLMKSGFYKSTAHNKGCKTIEL